MIYCYYLEIKNRCILLLLNWVCLFFVNYNYKEILLFLCLKPSLVHKNKISYFIFTDIKEIFYVYIKLIFTINNQIFIYFFIFHCFIFVSLGLYKTEYEYFKNKVYTIILFWFFSLFILNNVILPISLNFFFKFSKFFVIYSYKFTF